MKSSDNGTPENCLTNLLRIKRGEVCFDVMRGLDGSLIDMPVTQAASLLRSQAYWVASEYEPRINFTGANLSAFTGKGEATITASI